MDPVDTQISSSASDTPNADGSVLRTLSDAAAARIAKGTGMPLPRIYRRALKARIWPMRYLRNSAGLTVTQQAALADAGVAVVGAGGLGGHVIGALARIGIGRLVVIDGDRFDETNLNRQLLATSTTLGQLKAQVAADYVQQANPGVAVTAKAVRMDDSNADTLLADTDVVVDALDNIPSRRILAQSAQHRHLPLVHGAVAGFDGHVMTIMPGDPYLETIYGPAAETADPTQAAEKRLGVPSITPALIAAMQAMEVVKLICGIGSPFHRRMHHVDLLAGECQQFEFNTPDTP